MEGSLILLWAIWKERNRIVFEDAAFSTLRLKHSIICSLFTWVGCNPNADISFVQIRRLCLGASSFYGLVCVFSAPFFSPWPLGPFFVCFLYTHFPFNEFPF